MKRKAILFENDKDIIERFLDAIWMERGLSENTLSAYRADLIILIRHLFKRKIYSPKLAPSQGITTEAFLKSRELFGPI